MNEVSIIVDEREIEDLIKEFPGAEGEIRREIERVLNYFNQKPFKEKERRFFIQKIKQFIFLRNLNYKEEVKEVEEKEEDELKVVFDKDLDSLEFKEVEWIIPEILPEKSICFIAGKRGTFKSFLSMVISYCLPNELPLFNKFPVKKAAVLYLDEENGLNLIKERANKIKKGLNITQGSEDIAFVSFQNIKLDNSYLIEKFEDFIMKFRPKVIIVDSLRRFVSFDENDAGLVSRLFTDFLRPLSEKYGVSWVLLHHLRKGMAGKNPIDDMDELRGSSDLANYADVIMIVQRNKGSEGFILKQAKCRYKQEMNPKIINMEWTEDSLKMECLGDAEENLFADEACANLIIKWLSETEKASFNRKEAIDAMKSQRQSKATIERALRILINNTKLIKPKRGVYELNPDYNKTSEHQKHLDAIESKDVNEASQTSNYNTDGSLMQNIEVIKIR